MEKAMKKLILILLLISPFATFSNIWEKADGPYQYIPPFKMFSFNDELHIFSSDRDIYKYKSENDEWFKLDTGFFADKGIIYYFNQKDNVVITSTQKGVYWSYDYGVTWKFSDYKWKGNINALPFIAIQNQTIFLQSNNTSLYKLERDSDTFEKINPDEEKLDSIYGNVLVVKDDYIFAADPTQFRDRQPEFAKLYISKDKGETWTLSESMRKHIINLLFHGEELFAFTNKDEVYKSTDYGETWTTDTSQHISGKKVISYKDLIFACNNQVAVSSDGGQSWDSLSDGLDWVSCRDILINNNELYYLTGRQLIYTFDYDKKYWNRVTPLTDDVPQRFITEERDTLFSTGLFTINYSIDNGKTWKMYSDSLYYKYTILKSMTIRDSIFIAVDQWGNSFYISTDYGRSWRFENLGNFDSNGWIGNILIMDNRILLTSSKFGHYISKDAGLNWEKYENVVLKSDSLIYNYFRLNDSDIILYGTNGLYKSNDNGLSWEYEKTDNEMTRVGVYSSRDGNNVYTLDFNNNKLFKSTDLGRTWTNLALNIEPGLNWKRIISYNGSLVLFTTTDVFISDNDGLDWRKYEVDLQSPDGKELYFNYGIVSGDYLVLISDSGNWRAKLSDLGIVKTSVESEIERNYLYTYPPYPNPAKSEVKVLFYWDINLPMTSEDISIYDITGKKIDAVGNISLVKQESHYGNIIWDCSSAQPGIYLINIKHGTEEKAVKVVVE